MNSEGWSAKSSRVMTAFTPGSASAFDVSIATMRAWGCGLRSTRPMSWRGRLRSAPTRARRVTLSPPSGRMVRVPTYPCPFVPFSAMALTLSHHDRGALNGGHDLVVPGAPAEVAGEPVTDLRLARIRIALEQGPAGHQEAGRADPALQRRVLQELRLQRMERLALGHALDRLDPAPAYLAAQHEARADEPAIERHAAAPQSPEAQPSLLPVRCSVSRRTSSSVSSVSQRNSTASPFTVVSMWCLAITGSSLGPARSRPSGAPARRRSGCGIPRYRACHRSACRRPGRRPPGGPALHGPGGCRRWPPPPRAPATRAGPPRPATPAPRCSS